MNDLRTLGLGTVTYRLAKASSRTIVRTRLRNVGAVTLRRGNSDLDCFRQVWGSQEYSLKHLPEVEARIRQRYRDLVDAGRVPVVLDGGANVGAASLWFRAEYPKATVIAVEPDEANFAILAENVASAGNVVAVKAALGAEPGFVHLTAPDSGWAVQSQRSSSGTPITTIADAIGQVPGGELFIAKIDIEGFEKDLFSSNVAWIDSAYVVYVEPHDWMLPGQFSSSSFLKAMSRGDFEMFICGENLAFVRA